MKGRLFDQPKPFSRTWKLGNVLTARKTMHQARSYSCLIVASPAGESTRSRLPRRGFHRKGQSLSCALTASCRCNGTAPQFLDLEVSSTLVLSTCYLWRHLFACYARRRTFMVFSPSDSLTGVCSWQPGDVPLPKSRPRPHVGGRTERPVSS